MQRIKNLKTEHIKSQVNDSFAKKETKKEVFCLFFRSERFRIRSREIVLEVIAKIDYSKILMT